MRKIFLSFVFLMFLGMTYTNELYAQKPLTAMTETELSSLSDGEIKKHIFKDWGGLFTLMKRGVKLDKKIVDVFAKNFKEGAMVWNNKTKYATIDYVTAEDLLSFYKLWYIGRNSCYKAFMDMYKETYPVSFEQAMYGRTGIAYTVDIFYQKQQSGWLTQTPPEYVDAKTLINSMEP